MDKARVVAQLRASVQADVEALVQVTGDARDEATSGESKAENKYDTRATEASYLAAGQGERLLALRALSEWLEQLDPASTLGAAGPGALVGVDRDGVEEWVFLGPQGGHRVAVDGVQVLLISTDSPFGAVLSGLEAGDAGEVETPRGTRVLEVTSVR